jgi:hypothetical protein
MNEAKNIIANRRVPVCVILVFFVSLPFWPKACCDTGWYVVPIELTKTDSTIELAFLNMFINKIVGVGVENNMKTEVHIQGEGFDSIGIYVKPVIVGRIETETLRVDTVMSWSVGYAFGEIEILEATDTGLRIRIAHQGRSLGLKDVTYLISGGIDSLRVATSVWTSPTDSFYRDEHKHIPLSQVKRIRTIGEVLSIPYGG